MEQTTWKRRLNSTIHFLNRQNLTKYLQAIPFDEEPATNGNGTMIGFSVGSTEEVIRLHKKAIELGGTSEGEPTQKGPRFSGYVRDLDNNKLCFFE